MGAASQVAVKGSRKPLREILKIKHMVQDKGWRIHCCLDPLVLRPTRSTPALL